MICHILLDLSIYGGFSQISLPDAIRFVWKTSCTLRKVDRGWQIYFDYSTVINIQYINIQYSIVQSPVRVYTVAIVSLHSTVQ